MQNQIHPFDDIIQSAIYSSDILSSNNITPLEHLLATINI